MNILAHYVLWFVVSVIMKIQVLTFPHITKFKVRLLLKLLNMQYQVWTKLMLLKFAINNMLHNYGSHIEIEN
jgi:hypothetical protein